MLRAFGDGSLFGEVYGEGPIRVIWLHGWGRTHDDFAAAATLLADRGISSLALDLWGFGASPPPRTAGGARQYADQLAPLLQEFSPEPVWLVGHSFGGRAAVALAATHPHSVAGIVATGAPLLRPQTARRSPWRYRVVRFLAARHLIGPQRLEAARQKYGSVDYRRASGVMREVLVLTVNESYEAELDALSCPLALMWGRDDHDVPVSVAHRVRERAQAQGRHVPLDIVEGVGHLTPTSAPEALVHTLWEHGSPSWS